MKTKSEKIAHYDQLAGKRLYWRERNAYYYHDMERFLAGIIPEGRRILEIGCGTGDLLYALRPSFGLGVDFSVAMIEQAKQRFVDHSSLKFQVEDAEALGINEKFDYVIMSDMLGELTDVWQAFQELRKVTHNSSRVVITYFNGIWGPLLEFGEKTGLKMPQDNQNWLDIEDINNLLRLNDFEVISQGYRFLFPIRIPFLSTLFNRFLGRLPLLNRLGLVSYVVARPTRCESDRIDETSVSVIVPCRNEKGNIRPAVERIPDMGSHTEIIFVDGNSNDGTVEEIEHVIAEYAGERDIKLIHQVPPDTSDGEGHGRMLKLGKGDAVRKGFAEAKGDVLMILDADLTVPPEELPRFYSALTNGYGDFVNGTRLVYPMEDNAMRTLNKYANYFFGWLFSWLLEQPIKDTLCGTKVLYRKDYLNIVRNRAYFGDFDPFGDFDLLFGAAKQNLKIIEMPVHYKERTYGDIKIERFRHGILLLKMCWFAMRKLKFR